KVLKKSYPLKYTTISKYCSEASTHTEPLGMISRPPWTTLQGKSEYGLSDPLCTLSAKPKIFLFVAVFGNLIRLVWLADLDVGLSMTANLNDVAIIVSSFRSAS